MIPLRLKFVAAVLAIISIVLFVGCMPDQEPVKSVEISPTIMSEVSVESLPIEATQTKWMASSLTPTPDLPIESNSTSTPEPTIPTTTTDLSNRIYTFVSDTGFHYGWLDPFTNHREEVDISSYGIVTNSIGSSATLSFSPFSNKVAFWVRNPGEPGTLWLSNIEIKEPLLIFIDEDELYSTDKSFPPKDVTINWFPNDKYLLMESTDPDIPNTFVDISDNSYQQNWESDCKSVIASPKTSEFALFCVNDNEGLIIEWDGEIWIDPNITEDNIVWSWEDDYMLPLAPTGSVPPWSPNGTKIAFIPVEQQDTLEIITSSGESLIVDFEVEALLPHTIRWIGNEKNLVGGYREDGSVSWFIVDSQSGKLLWSLEKTSGFDLSPQQQAEHFLLSGEVSKSGEYLILSTKRTDIPSGNQLFLIDLKNNQFLGPVADIGHGLDAYVWGR